MLTSMIPQVKTVYTAHAQKVIGKILRQTAETLKLRFACRNHLNVKMM